MVALDGYVLSCELWMVQRSRGVAAMMKLNVSGGWYTEEEYDCDETLFTSLHLWMKCGFQSQSAKIDMQPWKSNTAGRRPVNANLCLMLPRMLQILQMIVHLSWSCQMIRI